MGFSMLKSVSRHVSSFTSLSVLLRSSDEELSAVDVAAVNLACAIDLPGAETLNVVACLETLNGWAEGVRRYTQGCMGEYQQFPERFHRHRGFARFTAMVTYLRHPKGLGIGYQPTAIGNTIYSDSRDDLLHGLLTRRLGTCTSLPALYVAIGRRLGYPMGLAIAKGHVLCQWVEKDGSHVNLEGSTVGGAEMYPDEYYQSWPHAMTKQDLASGRYLRPLTRGEEFGFSLETRGHVLTDNRRFDEAKQAYEDAYRVSGGWSQREVHLSWMAHVQHQLAGRGKAVSGIASLAADNFQPCQWK